MNHALRSLLRDVAAGHIAGPRAEQHTVFARETLHPKRRGPAKPGPTRAEDRVERRRKHAEGTARIREERMRISGGRCEGILLSKIDFMPVCPCPYAAVHMHHLEGGSGRRRQRQTVENVRMLCEFHHREAHRAARRTPPGQGEESR